MNCIGPFIIRRHSIFKIITSTATVQIRFSTPAFGREVVAQSGGIRTVDVFDLLVRIMCIFSPVVGKV